ncbi:hypothetical protein HS088_TW10G00611 [Tripterygium wilfordii]|uniref:Peptidase M14 carboxypeptidase A domain-containing protein n=1 Tax=Tripterygium wilfordii TaxID=458696 RepID=A0A7J7D5H2_TRIWF|nr:hypothetical protein HS088_TW10G00611 [Tripterygium wilfordii]
MEQITTLVHRHPDKLSVNTFKSGNKGYNAEITVVTYCQSGRESDDRSKFRILLSFGQHGRELITSELALRMLSILSEEQFLPNMDPSSLNMTLDNLIIKDYEPYEENPGTAPFSEPETQIMRKLALSFDPHIWVNRETTTMSPTFVTVFLSLLIFYLFFISSFTYARLDPTPNAENFINSLNLFPDHDVSIVNDDSSINNASRLVEKRFKFYTRPNSKPSIEDLGHCASYYRLPHAIGARCPIYNLDSP